MMKKSIFKKGTYALFALTLLAASPSAIISTLNASQLPSGQEQRLFDSLRKLLFQQRSMPRKKWAEWCKEWISFISAMPQYASLKKDLEKVSRWSNAQSIASRLEKALEPYVGIIPEDILQRVDYLGQEGMIELIDATLKGRPANLPE